MPGYSAREVARLLDLGVGRIRGFVRAGFLSPERGPRGEYRFSFQDLVLLRSAKALVEARIPARRVRSALQQLRRQLPEGRPLTGVFIRAEGAKIVVRDGGEVWNPESGQVLFDFGVAELATKVAPLDRRRAREARRDEAAQTAEDWYQLGCELEVSSPVEARDAYRRALELDPSDADARLNLGRLLHEAGQLSAAEAHYRAAIEARSDDAVAWFNLGVSLEDQGDDRGAIDAYRLAIELDPEAIDAHYNLGHLYDRIGRPILAARYLSRCRELEEERPG